MSKAVIHDYWRHFTPVAPNLEVTIKKNTVTTVDMSDIFIQGAKDIETGLPDLDIIRSVGAQRGWLLNWYVEGEPTHGFITDYKPSLGITYKPNYNYIGTDCINYRLIVNGQASNVGRIDITIENAPSANIIIHKQTGNDFVAYYEAVLHDTPTYEAATYNWYHLKPVKYRDHDSGRSYVYIDKVKFAGSVYNQTTNTITDIQSTTATQTYTYNDPYYQDCYLEDNTTYIQPDNPWPVLLEVSLHSNPVVVNNQYTGAWQDNTYITTDIRQIYGESWWLSGAIQQV